MGTNRAQRKGVTNKTAPTLPFGAKYGQLGYELITTKLQTLHRSSLYLR